MSAANRHPPDAETTAAAAVTAADADADDDDGPAAGPVMARPKLRHKRYPLMNQLSRDPTELVGQTICKHHAYPDGFALFLGTMFAPIVDRGTPGQGFTHKIGDIVRVSSEKLGVLENKVTTCCKAPVWEFGIADLMRKGDVSAIKEAIQLSGEKGIQSFDASLVQLFKAGRVSLDDALANADSRSNLEAKINFG